MNAEHEDSRDASRRDDTGEPIRLLLDQQLEPSAHFVEKIRRRIYRRTAASQLASYSWHLPKVMLVEMFSVVTHFLRAFGTKKES